MNAIIHDVSLDKKLVNDNKHNFIYSYSADTRKEFINNIIESNPIEIGSDSPFAIKMSSIGFPNIEQNYKEIVPIMLSALSREYFNYLYACDLISNILNQVDRRCIKNREQAFVERFKKYFLSSKVNFLENILDELVFIKNMYLDAYYEYMCNGNLECLTALPTSVLLDPAYLTMQLKKMLNITSYGCALLECPDKRMLTDSYKAINNLINSRINDDLSINVICFPEAWKSFSDQRGHLMKCNCDYNILDLEDSEMSLKKTMNNSSRY